MTRLHHPPREQSDPAAAFALWDRLVNIVVAGGFLAVVLFAAIDPGKEPDFFDLFFTAFAAGAAALLLLTGVPRLLYLLFREPILDLIAGYHERPANDAACRASAFAQRLRQLQERHRAAFRPRSLLNLTLLFVTIDLTPKYPFSNE